MGTAAGFGQNAGVWQKDDGNGDAILQRRKPEAEKDDLSVGERAGEIWCRGIRGHVQVYASSRGGQIEGFNDCQLAQEDPWGGNSFEAAAKSIRSSAFGPESLLQEFD